MKALAIDIGGTHVSCACVEDRRILARATLLADRRDSLAALLPEIAAAAGTVLREAAAETRECAGVAVGFCGIVDSERSRLLTSNEKYPNAGSVDLVAWSREQFGLPLAAENDARMALLGEWYAGSAAGFDDVAMLTLGTGVGGAAMIGGRLLRGKHFQAGCLGGHFPVSRDGRPCNCGNVGCVEAEASTWALPGIAKSWPGYSGSLLAHEPHLDFEALFRALDAGDAVAGAIVDHCIRTWAAGAVAMVHAYDPEVVVLGGGVMRRGGIILPRIRKHIEDHSWTPWGRVEVRAASLGSNAALLGAIPLLEERRS